MHQQAWTDPVFLGAYAIEPLPFCRGCHAPMADISNSNDPARLLGVGCVTCHVAGEDILGVRDVEARQLARAAISSNFRFLRRPQCRAQRESMSNLRNEIARARFVIWLHPPRRSRVAGVTAFKCTGIQHASGPRSASLRDEPPRTQSRSIYVLHQRSGMQFPPAICFVGSRSTLARWARPNSQRRQWCLRVSSECSRERSRCFAFKSAIRGFPRPENRRSLN